jgi:hypothetical protein
MTELRDDPEYQLKMAAAEAEREEHASRSRTAEQPIVADLRSAGVEVNSVWDLVNTSDPYPGALPVLMEHLERGGYPERAVENLGRALAVKPSVAFWARSRPLAECSGLRRGRPCGGRAGGLRDQEAVR